MIERKGTQYNKISFIQTTEKVEKKEHMAEKCLSPEFRQQENLQKKEHMAQKRSSSEFKQHKNLQQKEHMAQKCSSS